MAELDVWIGDRRVATLDGTDRDRLRIEYARTWLDDPEATPLSMSMPLVGRAHAGPVVAAYLWGLLTDNDAVLRQWARTYETSATNVFGLLQGVGRDVAGAAQYLEAGVDPTEPGPIDALTGDEVAALLAEVTADRPWPPTRLGRWSLAGAQAKLALHRDPATGTWGIPHGATPTTHILKPSIAEFDRHDLNEHLCLAAAGRVGLRAARTWVERFGTTSVIVVERYDRTRRDGRLLRIHQEDGCQALGVHPASKYEHQGGPTLEDLAKVIWDHVGAPARDDIRALVLAAAYNWLVLAPDGHAKNFSFLLSGPEVRLAPLYDVASIAPYDAHPRKVKLAQKIAGECRMHVIGRRHWEQLARTVRLQPDEVVDRIVAMAEAIPDAFAEAAADLSADDQAAVTKLRDLVAAWAGRCADALRSDPGGADPS